jgi:4-amino-4-deoxy-L-arabinose transferase-like glycosyltransferase
MRGRWLAGAILLGLALRLGFGLGYWVGKPLTLLLAHNLAAGRGFSYASPASGQVEGRHVGRAPLYPVFLAALAVAVPGSAMRADRIPESVPAEVKVAQALLGCALIWLVGRWASRVVGDGPGGDRAAAAAAVLAAVYPPLVWIGSYVLSESLYAVLALLAAWLVDRAVASSAVAAGSPGAAVATRGVAAGLRGVAAVFCSVAAGLQALRAPAVAFAGGIVTGLATLTRPAILIFLALAAAWLVARRRPMLAAALAVGAMVAVAPWTARNQAVHGRFVLVASEGGVTFWTGNNRLARGEGDLAANPGMKPAALAIERAHADESPEALEGVFYRAAFDDIRDEPGRWLTLLARKAFYTVVPVGPSYMLHSRRFIVASAASYLLVLPFAAAGAWRLRLAAGQPMALWLLAAASVLVCLIFFPQERFRIPVIDPVLIVCAAACVPAGAAAAGDLAGRR